MKRWVLKSNSSLYRDSSDNKIYFIAKESLYPFFKEYIESLQLYLKNSIVFTYKNEVDIYRLLLNKGIFIFIQTPPSVKTNRRIFLLNTEQLTIPKQKDNIIKYYKEGNFTHLIDYSRSNIHIINHIIPIPKLYFPYQYNPTEIKNYEKTKDCIFIGWPDSQERSYILNNIPNITIISSKFGDERDDILFRHKILVNIHFNKNYNIHEQLRTTRCIFNKMIVITEPSLDDDINPLKEFMIITDYENIAIMVNKVLANYQEYYTKLFSKSFENCILKLKDNIISIQNEIKIH